MHIRPATLEDAPVLQKLLRQLGPEYTRNLKEIENRIQAFTELPRQQLLLAVNDAQNIMGMIAFGFYEQFRLQGCCCHIDTLVIDSAYRGQGVGKFLVEVAEKQSSKEEATEIELTTANYRKAHGTHDFYTSIGYANHSDIDCSYFVKQTWK